MFDKSPIWFPTMNLQINSHHTLHWNIPLLCTQLISILIKRQNNFLCISKNVVLVWNWFYLFWEKVLRIFRRRILKRLMREGRMYLRWNPLWSSSMRSSIEIIKEEWSFLYWFSSTTVVDDIGIIVSSLKSWLNPNDGEENTNGKFFSIFSFKQIKPMSTIWQKWKKKSDIYLKQKAKKEKREMFEQFITIISLLFKVNRKGRVNKREEKKFQ